MNLLAKKLLFFFWVIFKGLLSFCTEFYYVSVPICFPEERISKFKMKGKQRGDLAGHQGRANFLQQGR